MKERASDIEAGITSLVDIGESRPFERVSTVSATIATRNVSSNDPGQKIFAASVQREIAKVTGKDQNIK